ncbi:amino acid ABC transporter permease [Nonomuraea sp. KC401]|uniref:Amino acid ABC transporter permease n=1 Tax=Nonomuraea longispora TaxID=1848320 RepID=A0A4V2XKM6_9ACTN|nr:MULTISPECIES: amino acid ABC transporter permease [Nonomuraea]NBE92011.1 ABC transporter permease subunit [Nonomuraea sp. K271]TDC07056.1 amino acid ABC transporter permease [Nonomuraea longispora]TLF58259.1 amino acid ABC transporter permease [Nonomuraea sp. KC401]
MSTSVLFDAPGRRGRLRNHALTVVSLIAVAAVVYGVYRGFDAKGQWEGKIWEPFLQWETWEFYIIPGLIGTLRAAAVAAVLALAFGAIFGLARLSDHAWIRVPAGAVVEVFRAIPLLLLIFFIFYLAPVLMGGGDYAFMAVVVGLMLYNGSVLAEVVRAGVQAVPKGQSEAAYAVGMRKNQVMRLVLLPQAVTAMMPAIVSQLVVLLKDTALGYIIAYVDLLNTGFKILPARFFGSLIPAAIVIGIIYVALNMALSSLATWLEGRSRRSRKTAAKPVTPAVAGMGEGAA